MSGTGHVADVFEASNGKCVVVWISPHSSTNVYDHIKDVETTHSHGGKSLVVWDFESAPDPDPMDALKDDERKPALTPEEMERIAEEVVVDAQKRVTDLVREKMSEPGEVTEAPEKEEDAEGTPTKPKEPKE
jgi:hypothetical protein